MTGKQQVILVLTLYTVVAILGVVITAIAWAVTL